MPPSGTGSSDAPGQASHDAGGPESAGAGTSPSPDEAAAPRVPMLVQAGCSALLATLLALAVWAGAPALLGLVLVVQLVLVAGFVGLVQAPAARAVFGIAAGAAVLADAVAASSGGSAGGLAAVVALSLAAGLVHQLLRPARSRVIESLADTMVSVVLVCGLACLLALRALPAGRAALLSCLAGAGVALVLGRSGDRIAPRPGLAVGATRGWPGLVLALGAGSLAAVAAWSSADGSRAALLGLATAAAVSAGDLTVDIGAAELRAGWADARRVAALRPVGLLMPFATLGPVAYLAGRLVLS